MSPVGLTLSYIGLWQAREKWVLGWSVKAPSPACSAWPTRSSIDWLYLVRSFLSEGRCCSLVALVSTRSSPSLPLSFSSTSCTALGGDLHHRKSSKRKKNDASELMGCHLYAYEKRAAFFSFLLESPISHFLNAEGTESHQHFGKHTTLMQLNHTHLKKKIRSTLRHLTEEVVLCRSCCEDSLINWNMNGSTQRVFGPVSSKQGKKVLTCCNAGAWQYELEASKNHSKREEEYDRTKPFPPTYLRDLCAVQLKNQPGIL